MPPLGVDLGPYRKVRYPSFAMARQEGSVLGWHLVRDRSKTARGRGTPGQNQQR